MCESLFVSVYASVDFPISMSMCMSLWASLCACLSGVGVTEIVKKKQRITIVGVEGLLMLYFMPEIDLSL